MFYKLMMAFTADDRVESAGRINTPLALFYQINTWYQMKAIAAQKNRNSMCIQMAQMLGLNGATNALAEIYRLSKNYLFIFAGLET